MNDDEIKAANDALLRHWWERIRLQTFDDLPTDKLIEIEKAFKEPDAVIRLEIRKNANVDTSGKYTVNGLVKVYVEPKPMPSREEVAAKLLRDSGCIERNGKWQLPPKRRKKTK